MNTEQINIRLDADIVSALERLAREEALDRATVIRRLLETSIKQWELEHALVGYRRGDLSLGRAAEEAGLTQWELIDAAREAGLAYPLDAKQTERRLAELGGSDVDEEETLPDVPPRPGGVLLIGINPAPISVAAGHYYQGRLGRRLWRRLERVGLLHDPISGKEDEAFARAGHGLTDLVKRPAASATELSDEELRAGVAALREKVSQWQPGLVLFAFKKPTRWIFDRDLRPGKGPELEGAPTFLLTGPYAPGPEAMQNEAELVRLLRTAANRTAESPMRTQRVTRTDLDAGRIRLPRSTKQLLPSKAGDVDIVLRGTRVRARYDPRTAGDRERSAVLSIGRALLQDLVGENEVLTVKRGAGGVPVLE
jgi:double-stranded uracil-DNA glycosylase